MMNIDRMRLVFLTLKEVAFQIALTYHQTMNLNGRMQSSLALVNFLLRGKYKLLGLFYSFGVVSIEGRL